MSEVNETLVRDIVKLVKDKQGDNLSRDDLVSVVEKVINELENSSTKRSYGHYSPSDTTVLPSNRFIVSVFGANRPGIVHGITGILAEMNCDILDLSQKFVENLFYMILVVEGESSPHDFMEIKSRLTRRGEELKAKVYVQNEDVFRYVNRL